MDANAQLDYLINVLQSLLAGEEIDMEEFSAVCRDKEARKQLKHVFEAEEN